MVITPFKVIQEHTRTHYENDICFSQHCSRAYNEWLVTMSTAHSDFFVLFCAPYKYSYLLTYIYIAQPTFDVESDVVRAVVVWRLSANLTVIKPVVSRTNVLDDQTPLARSLIVVDADARVADERKQADSQWVDVVMATPRDLQHVTWPCYVCLARDLNAGRHCPVYGAYQRWINGPDWAEDMGPDI